jgi:hypothetical protein
MADQQRWWRAAAVFGVLTVATAIWFLTRGMPSCGAPPLTSAMLDLELARSHAEFAAVLDCAPRLAELDFQNIVDLLLFMWVYTGLLVAFALAVRVPRAFVAGVGLLILGGDFVETVLLRHIAAYWPQLGGSSVFALATAVRIKFGAIGLLMGFTGGQLWRADASFAGRTVAVLTVIGAFASVAIIPDATRGPASQLLVAAWLAMTIYAGVRAFRRSPQPAPSSAGA